MKEKLSPVIIKLEIDEDDLDSGVDAIALVESPAIEEDFYLFSQQKMESYTDYPKAASENAQRALDWAEENGWGSCGTPVGKRRANQLANREPISEETIARMAAFERHRKNSKTPYDEGCGGLMWDAWGGDEGIAWAQRKLEQIKQQKEKLVESADGFRIGDYVSWTYAGRGEGDDRGRGQIKDLRVSGTLKVPGTDFELSPTEDRPAALIETRDGTLVGQYTENLRKIKKPEGFGIDVSDIPNYINEASRSLSELDGVPIFDNAEEAIIYSLIIGCEGEIHTHETSDGTVFYMPCVDMEKAQDLIEIIQGLKEEPKYYSDLPEDIQQKILDKLEEVAQDEDELIADMKKDKFAIVSTSELTSIMDYGKFRIRYVYTGPRDDKNRDFCRRLLDFQGGTNPATAKKVFRKEDINTLTITGENDQFGVYDIFTYKGSYGCRHHWSEVRYSIDDQTGNVIKQIQESINEATSVNAKPTRNRNPNSSTLTDPEAPKSEFQKVAGEKQIVAGPLMIPDKMIYRYDDFMGEYWVYFTKDTIEKIAHKFLIQKNQHNSNLEHSEYLPLENVSLVESWIIEDGEKDKAYSMTGKAYPKGTWFGLMKINDKTVWEEWIKTGRVNGFSVEGYFADKVINASNQKFYYRTTKGGTKIVIDHKTNVVFILEDGERKVVMPDGTYELTNGKTLVVRGGKAVKGSFSSVI